MDPLTITKSVFALAEAASKLYVFLKSIRHSDTNYALLCKELQGLTDNTQIISRTLKNCRQNPLALAPIDQDVWLQSGLAIADCQQIVNEFSDLVKEIGGSGLTNKFFRRAKLATEMTMHARDVVRFKDMIHMSTFSLQTLPSSYQYFSNPMIHRL